MKKLLVIAVATALIAPAAAMADTTLYGNLHASVGTVDSGTTSDTVVESHSSRLGVKGSTELDNGLSATYGTEFNLELDGDNSANNLTTRNQFVGLKGGFGEVRVGKHDTPAKLATSGLDAFGDTYGAMEKIVAADNHRVNNAVAYITKAGPVGLAVAHSTAPTTNDATASSTTAANTAMANYSNGPVYAGLGYTTIDSLATDINLGVGYKHEAGHFANVVYETVEGDATAGAGVPTLGLPPANATDTNIYVAGGFKTGAATLKAGYGSGDRDTGGEETMTNVGVDYSLGKKTSAYVLWSENENDARVLNGTAKTTATAVGLVTQF
ncbi:porin [Thiothrix fructosivorans]|jgi:predicted porin|uniref:Porin n=1 Tax=Thiothrix fructosivorans TaxID=111770 RepID=A0A8B0SRL7_9GAMM|nr:porin [Thiothrix fructosivorans]MBO0614176.1 porin [Thiothrix fructosivorans]QTX12658.1 porin [Thiothrix fructosivorans]